MPFESIIALIVPQLMYTVTLDTLRKVKALSVSCPHQGGDRYPVVHPSKSDRKVVLIFLVFCVRNCKVFSTFVLMMIN